MIKDITVRMSAKLSAEVAGKQVLLARIARRAATMLRHRIERLGRDHLDRPLPELPGRSWWFTSSDDPRVRGESLVPHFEPGQTGGKPKRLIAYEGYKRLKARRSGKTYRGGSFTGAMWQKLYARIVPGAANTRGWEIVLAFAGSQRVGYSGTTAKGRAKAVSIRHRDKAWRLQYATRDAANRPSGPRLFKLMWLTAGELGLLRDMWLAGLRLFPPGKETL